MSGVDETAIFLDGVLHAGSSSQAYVLWNFGQIFSLLFSFLTNTQLLVIWLGSLWKNVQLILGFLKTAFMVHPVPLLSCWCYLWFCCLFWWCYSLLCVCGNSQSELEKCRENSTCVTLLFRLFWLVSARDLKMDMGILNEKATFKRLRVSFSSRLK